MQLDEFWDWQVTSAFYVGVHLINAHIEKKTGNHYRSHESVKNAINPYSKLSLAKLSEEQYNAYNKLQWLSRRSRYLCKEKEGDFSTGANFTYDKHFDRALGYLNELIIFMNTEHKIGIEAFNIHCLEAKKKEYQHFVHKEKDKAVA